MRAMHMDGEVVYLANDVEAGIARLNKLQDDQDAAWSERVALLTAEIARLTAALAEANRVAIAKVAEATEARMKAEAALSESQAREAMLHRALPVASQPEAEPVAWQQRLASGGWGTILHGNDKPIGEARPLYDRPTPAPVVPTEGLREATMAVQQAFAFARDARPAGYEAAIVKIEGLLEGALLALRAQQPAAPVSGVTVQEAENHRICNTLADWAGEVSELVHELRDRLDEDDLGDARLLRLVDTFAEHGWRGLKPALSTLEGK